MLLQLKYNNCKIKKQKLLNIKNKIVRYNNKSCEIQNTNCNTVNL